MQMLMFLYESHEQTQSSPPSTPQDVQVIGQQIQANVNSNSILSAEIESAEIELSASAGRDGVIELGS